ncbi:hypothetical protein MBLNU459_g6257t1 [Dothideomycetes sp. NU459]
MAPITSTGSDASPVPLADHFFIAGIESSQIYDERTALSSSPPPVDATIDEETALETDPISGPRSETPTSPNTETLKRRSRYSWEARKSIGSIIGPLETNTIASNRSSATTLKGVQIEATPALSDEDFEHALRKFATERESFLEEIQVSAGTVVPPKPSRPRPKTVRITNTEDLTTQGPTARSGIGSLRRRISTMGGLKKQPSTRAASTRTSKRLSGYNSVIPAPQPFQPSPDMHPLKRRYEPVLLDRYPTKAMVDENKRRCPFPDYIPMFAFPNDVSVVSSDERPRSTWHGFAMTNSDGSKLPGICVTIWLPLNQSASAELERQCDAWRKANMSDEERELASSLGERLAADRTKLSRLLAKLPTVSSGSDERDVLDDEISAVEEKIALMTDLLRPVRHGAASKIEGLTDGETGFWIPRVYGVIGRDGAMTSFWKEWLKAITVPMMNGAVLRVPPSSPKTGIWQPLERYITNLTVEAPSPMYSLTQVEVGVRELRLIARREAINEIPGSRNTDLYALFRALTLPNIVTLFEYALSESRIILLSSHTSMLHLASAAINNLLYPLKWTGVFIPVLPARLIQALEAPCPYIVGVERRYENLELPEDDFVLVDLDQDTIESTARPTSLPRQQRRKLMALLQVAAPHHNRYGVPVGPPPYAVETFPNDAFSSENTQIYTQQASSSTLASFVGMNSTAFAENSGLAGPPQSRSSIYNAFLGPGKSSSRGNDRPATAVTVKGRRSSSTQSPPSPPLPSPHSGTFPPSTPVSRNDSGFGMQTSLRDKRSAVIDNGGRRNSSFGFDRMNNLRRPSHSSVQPFTNHASSVSTSTLSSGISKHNYAPSVYAASTLAASTVMPNVLYQPVRETETTKWVEGHQLIWKAKGEKTYCTICDEKFDDVSLVCPVAFRPDQVRAAFVRCFASLLYTYRRFLHPASGDRRKAGMIYHFNMDAFLKSVPSDNVEITTILRDTQAFNEFIHERESNRAENPSIKLFDEIVLAKRNRGRSSLFSKSNTSFLYDTTDHLWRSASTAPPNSRIPGDYRSVVSRIPAKLDPTLMKEPRAVQGAPRIPQARTKRKPIPSMLGLAVDTNEVSTK